MSPEKDVALDRMDTILDTGYYFSTMSPEKDVALDGLESWIRDTSLLNKVC
jgi:hypothetical protein